MKKKLHATFCIAALLSGSLYGTAIATPPKRVAIAAEPGVSEASAIMRAMDKELSRSMSKLRTAGAAPVYFIAYRIYDDKSVELSSSYGGLKDTPEVQHSRQMNVEVRVGSPQLDSNHHARNAWSSFMRETVAVPIEDDETALRTALWNETDKAFKRAQKSFKEVQSQKDVLAAEEDLSNDFSSEKPNSYTGEGKDFDLDLDAWQRRLRQASSIFKRFPKLTESQVTLRATKVRRYLVTSEGTKIEDEMIQYNVFAEASATADDGMRVWLYDHVETPVVKDLPDDKKLAEMVTKLAKSVEQLREARVAEPYAGPVILRSKAAGVFFHEVFGHRAEGHRQKDEDEGKTFTKMVGKKIMPSFITVRDDPTCQALQGKPLNGFYRYDDEGVSASNVILVNHGVLKTFLLGRSPIKGFSQSNGHGRCSPGSETVARQGNLIVESSKQVPYPRLRAMLIAEAKKQGKPYGLVFDEIAGGFTMTDAWMPQVFKLLPLRVYRVYTDGRPDELLRGVSIVGTPLVSLATIVCSANDCDTFNGNCGAESGWVPVSASSPSLLLDQLEIERQAKERDKPPLLPPPPKEH
ncbi:MAG: peptidase U62 [Cyanobacteria bacterium SZAS TMP-1]|nr:peptidase U62 [Cyanobacteria bacterium SZAS TMP-1]